VRPNQAHPNRARLLGDYGRLPLHFEENRGQTDAQVRFLSRGAGYALFLTRDEAVLQLRKAEPRSRNDGRQSPSSPQSATLRLKLLGANPEPRITGFNQLPGKANYLIGSDPSQWRANIPTYAKVHYRNVYAGVDLVYYGNQRQLEHDFVVAPGADPKQIRLAVEGAERVELEPQGDALLRVGDGEVRLRAPLAYQEISGRRQPVAARYALRERNPRPVPMQSGSEIRNPQSEELGFELGAYDPALPLVIDPVLVYSTYLGGSGNDIANGIAVDSDGNAYIAGQTLLADFPTNPLNARLGPTNTPGALDVFVAKLNYTGSSLMFSTYLGGSGDDVGTGIALNSSGSAYVTGSTMSTDFPTTLGAYQSPNPGGQDAFVTKLAPDGSALVYSVRLGGGSIDVGRGIAVDSNGNAYVTGETFSTNFPTWNASQTSNGAVWDAFVTKLNPAGSALLYSTYLGGNADDMGRGIAVDTLGNAYVTGDTRSTDFPTTPGAFQTAGGGYDAFVTKLSATGARVYSTCLGGNSTDYGRGIAVDSNQNAYVTGLTASTNFPTLSAFQGTLGSNLSTCSVNECFDAFAAKLNTAGSALVYSTFLGGAAYDGGNSIAVDSNGNAYIAGATASTDFPTAGAYQPANGGMQDAFVLKLGPSGSALLFSTFLGGAGIDSGNGVAVDAGGAVYLAGETQSTNFPTVPTPLQDHLIAGGDAFIAKLTPPPGADLLLAMTAPSNAPFASDFDYTLTVTNNGPVTATNVVLTDELPTPLSLVSYTGSGAECGGAPTITCALPNIPSGSNVVITLTVHPLAIGPVTNTASVTAAQPDPNPTNNSASADTFISESGVGALTITSLNPPNAMAAGPTFTLTINGSGFGGNSYVYWNDVSVPTTYDSPTKLTASINKDYIAAPSTAQVRVFDSMGGWSNSVPFLVYAASGSAPTIGSLSPSKAVAGGDPFPLTINGSNFSQNSMVYWNDVSVPTTYDNPTKLTASISKDYIAAPSTAQVKVFDSTGGWSNGAPFVVYSLSGQAGCTPPPADLKLWWPADGDTNDLISGNWWAYGYVRYAPGKVGLAFDFSSNAYLYLPYYNYPSTTGQQITIDAWIMPPPSSGRIVDKLFPDTGASSGYALEVYNDEINTYLRLIIATGTGTAELQSTTPLITDGSTWTHVAGVYDGANMKLYINGAPAGSSPLSGAVLLNGSVSLSIGIGQYSGGMYHGRIDELEIFDRALAVEEIAAIANAGSVGKCWAGVVAGADVQVDLMLFKSAPNPAPLSQGFLYTLTVINTSPDPAYNVVLTDTLPPGMTLSFLYWYQGACTGESTVTCSFGTVWGWSYASVEVWVYTDQPGPATNAASVSSVNPDSNMSNNIASVEVTVATPAPVISYTDPDSAVAGTNCDGPCTLWVHGSYFGRNSVVRWNGAPRPTYYYYDDVLYAQISNEDLARPGMAQVTVYDPGSGLESAPQVFLIYPSSTEGCLPPPSGMVSWWAGEGNGNDVFGRNPGTPHGPVAFAPGEVGRAFSLDGNSYIEVPDSPSLAISDYITIDAWIKRTADTGACATIVDKITTGGSDGFLLAVCPGEVGYYLRMVVGPWVLNGSTPIPLDEPVHVAGVFSGYELALYVNGVQDNSLYLGGGGDLSAQGGRQALSTKGKLTDYTGMGYAPIPTNNLSLRIGANHEGTENFIGLIDEVEVYNTALYSEISAIYTAGPAGKCNPFACAPPPPDLVSWWPGETDGRDLAGANPATPQGSVTFVPAMVGQGFHFDGTNSYLEVADSASLKPNGFTIDAWVKFDSFGYDPVVLVSKYDMQTDQYGYMLFATPTEVGHGFAFKLVSPGGAVAWLMSNMDITPGVFYHVAATWGSIDGMGSAKLYVNGSLADSASSEIPPSYDTRPLLLGTTGDPALPWWFAGTLDEVEFYGRALSSEEIASIYMAGGAGKCTALYSPDLVLTKEATLNSNLTYTLTVTNNSAQAATGVTVTDVLPEGVSFVSAVPAQGSCTGGATVTCNLGTLIGGAAPTTITLVTQPAVSGEVTNTATVSGNEPDPDTSNNTATVKTTIVANPVPLITSIDPVERAAGSGGFLLTVSGVNFISGSTVQWAGSARSTTYGSGTQLTAQISDTDAATASMFLVTAVNPAPGGGTSAGMPFTVHPAGSYLVGDAAPAGGNDSGLFGDDSLDNPDLILALRAVTSVPGFLPPNCADLFDAMDSYPVDNATRGGDGVLDNLDLIATLRRVTNADPSRPRRATRGLVCSTMAPGLLAMLARPAELPSGAGAVEFQREQPAADGAARVAVYLAAYRDVDLGGLSLAFGWSDSSLAAQAPLRFVSAAAGAPALLDNRLPGTIAAAWLGGLRLRAGQRLLLGFVDLPAAGGQVSFPVLHGVKANDRTTGRQVPIGAPQTGGTRQSPMPR